MDNANPNLYTITATRGAVMASDPCGDYTINQSGQKRVVNWDTSKYATIALASRACWK